LKPGTYTFKVKAIGVAQKWSDTFPYTFTIRSPWHQTAWAYMGYFLLAGLLAYRLIRWRTRQKELEQQVDQATQTIQQEKKSRKSISPLSVEPLLFQ